MGVNSQASGVNSQVSRVNSQASGVNSQGWSVGWRIRPTETPDCGTESPTKLWPTKPSDTPPVGQQTARIFALPFCNWCPQRWQAAGCGAPHGHCRIDR
eukprot:1069252-Prorocentrum_minimum.AAC.1